MASFYFARYLAIVDAPDDSAHFETAVAAPAKAVYVLRLFITGTTPRSTRAMVNIRKICEEHLHKRYDLEVVDISQKPTLAEGEPRRSASAKTRAAASGEKKVQPKRDSERPRCL